MEQNRLIRRGLLAAAALVAAASLAGCSDDAQKDSSAPHPAATASTNSDAAAATSTPAGDNGDLDDPVGARADLVGFTCDAKGGVWSASGKLTNQHQAKTDYLVRATVFDAKGDTVRGSATVTKTVAAGHTARVSFPEIYHAGPDDHLRCAARVVRGS